MTKAASVLLLCALPLAAQDCAELRHRGRAAEARRCYAALAESRNACRRAEGLWGLGEFKNANDTFREAIAADPKNAACKVRWGRMLLERFNQADAAGLFSEALEAQPSNAGAMLGLALVAADGFENKAVEMAQKALASDPKLVEAQELLARLALEDGDMKRAAAEADKAIAMSGEAFDAMAVRASIDWLNAPELTLESPWMDRIAKINPAYGEAWAEAARFFVINRRYREGIRLYRKAVELSPDLWSAHSQLGVNLMRLGEDAEARRELELCYNNGFVDYATKNTLVLLDSYKNFTFFRERNIVLKLDKKEAEALRPYFETEIERAMKVYEKKYGVTLKEPVQVEVYPNHEDFAVRTMGMPGLGALGVTFGRVVAMDSPSSRPPGSFHWASTLWHEMSHVYVLTATEHRVPRWFTEGVAVHEETATSPDWGDRLSAEAILAIKEKKLLPVAQLDRGFVRPTYPAQVVVSYFQAGKLCDYISKTWGEQKLVAMIHAFAERKTTPEAIQTALAVSPEELDKRFFAWLDTDTKKTVDGFEEWRKRMRALAEAAKAGRNDDVIRDGPALRDLYPEYVEHGNAYELIAEAREKKGDAAGACAELERYSQAGGRDPAAIKKLATLLEKEGKGKEAAAALGRLIYIDPLDEELHRRLGDLRMAQGNPAGAIGEYKAVIALRPHDVAASHFSLARAYRAAARVDDAKEQLLMALEAAPGFRPAQRMLLELNQ